MLPMTLHEIIPRLTGVKHKELMLKEFALKLEVGKDCIVKELVLKTS